MLGLAPQKKLSRRMITKADNRYKAKKYGTTQKAQEGRPPSVHAMYLLNKFEGNLPTTNIAEYKADKAKNTEGDTSQLSLV